MPNEYLKTVERLEPSIHPIDSTAGWASIAVSLKRIADAMQATYDPALAAPPRVMLKPDDWWIGLGAAERERLVATFIADGGLNGIGIARGDTPAGEAAIETTGGTRTETVLCSDGPLGPRSVPTAWVVGQLLADAGAHVTYLTTGNIRQVVISGRTGARFSPPIAIEFPLAPAFLRRPDAGAVLSPDGVETLQSLLDAFFYDGDAADAILTRLAEKGMSGPLVRVKQLLADIGLWPNKEPASDG